MQIRHEIVQYQNPFLCLKIWEIGTGTGTAGERQTTIPSRPSGYWHYHEQIEFLYILEGEMEVFVPEERWQLHPEDVLLLGSSQLHRTRKLKPELRYIVFQLDLESHFDQTVLMHRKHFSERIRPLTALNSILLHNAAAKAQIGTAIQAIYAEVQRKDKGYELSVSMLVKSIFLTLIRHDSEDLLEYSRGEQIEELEPALLYVDKHLTEKLNVSAASRCVNLSYHHFLRRFHKAIGMTFTQYVNYKRIKRAEQLLLTEDISIEAIACSVGIPNRAHFYEMFQRHHGCSPRQFQAQLKHR